MADEPLHHSRKSLLKKIFYNSLVVMGIGLSSMISTQAAKSVYTDKFNATYFVTYITTIFNSAMFPLYTVGHLLLGLHPHGFKPLLQHCIDPFKKVGDTKGKTYFRLWWTLLLFTALWISAIYTYIKSLSYLIPTDVSTLFATSNVFVFVLSIVLLKEKFYFTKLASVLLASSGVVIFFYSEKLMFDKTLGIMIALLTAFLSAFYKVIYKVIIKNGTMAQVSFTLTIIGINTAIYYWPLIFVFHHTKTELITSFKYIPWKELSIRGSCSVIMNFFITFGIAYINSLVASIGGILAIPFNAIVDVILKRKTANLLKAIGSILIICSFILLLIPERYLDLFESCWKHSPKSLQSVNSPVASAEANNPTLPSNNRLENNTIHDLESKDDLIKAFSVNI